MTRVSAGAAFLVLLAASARAQTASPPVVSTRTESALRAARPGDVVALPDFPFATLPVLPLSVSAGGGPVFLLSDAPEYFRTGDGVSLQENLPAGSYRLYLYEVPRPADAAKTITAIVENLGPKPLRLTVERAIAPEPSTDYVAVAKRSLRCFLDDPGESRTVAVPARGWAPLDPRIDHRPASGDALVHAIFEFTLDQPARLSVLQKSPARDSREAAASLPKLPLILPGQAESGSGRGVFPSGDLDADGAGPVYDSAQGPAQLIVADGVRDQWVVGRDGITGAEGVQDKGNYGIRYRIRVRYRSSADAQGVRRGVAVLFASHAAKGAPCSPAAGVVRAEDGLVDLPAAAEALAGEPDAALIREYPPVADGATGVIELAYSPPGASCLPTPLLLVPYRP
jgi:hypothetical protein